MVVAQIERSGVNQDTLAFFSGDFKSPEGRFRERVFKRSSLIDVVTDRAISLV